mmetsp:Transcript_19040/g.48039  ORF Transcript_19040/g.48039 Transcript_19040/m.48039 type:complete len:448 (+) Transcript_19040:964-2307(+)
MHHLVCDKGKVFDDHAYEEVEHDGLRHELEQEEKDRRVLGPAVAPRLGGPVVPVLWVKIPVEEGGAEGGPHAAVVHQIHPLVPCHHLEAKNHGAWPRLEASCGPEPVPESRGGKERHAKHAKHAVHEEEEHDDVEQLGDALDQGLEDDAYLLDDDHQAHHAKQPERLDKLCQLRGLQKVAGERPHAHKHVKVLPHVVDQRPGSERERVQEYLGNKLQKKYEVLLVDEPLEPRLGVHVVGQHEAHVDRDARGAEDLEPDVVEPLPELVAEEVGGLEEREPLFARLVVLELPHEARVDNVLCAGALVEVESVDDEAYKEVHDKEAANDDVDDKEDGQMLAVVLEGGYVMVGDVHAPLQDVKVLEGADHEEAEDRVWQRVKVVVGLEPGARSHHAVVLRYPVCDALHLSPRVLGPRARAEAHLPPHQPHADERSDEKGGQREDNDIDNRC